VSLGDRVESGAVAALSCAGDGEAALAIQEATASAGRQPNDAGYAASMGMAVAVGIVAGAAVTVVAI